MEYIYIFLNFAVSITRSMKCVREFESHWVEERKAYKENNSFDNVLKYTIFENVGWMEARNTYKNLHRKCH
jgi:hypothetical protein